MELTILNGKSNSVGGTRIKPTAELYMDDFPELLSNAPVQDLLRAFDHRAESSIRRVSAPAIEFAMTKKSMLHFVDQINRIIKNSCGDDIYEAVYEAVNKNNTLYRFYLTIDAEDFENRAARSLGYLYRKRPGEGWEEYDRFRRAWNGGEDIQMLFDCTEGTGAKRAFADALQKRFGTSLQAAGTTSFKHYMESARNLFELYDRLDGLGRFQMLCVHDGFPEDRMDKSFKAALRSESLDRMGCCIYFKDGKYRICQMHDMEQNEDGLIFFDAGEPMDRNRFFYEICETDDMDALCGLLESMWDRSCRGRQWMTLPISDRAYVNFPCGGAVDDEVHYVSGDPELTDSEAYALKQLKKTLQKGKIND